MWNLDFHFLQNINAKFFSLTVMTFKISSQLTLALSVSIFILHTQ